MARWSDWEFFPKSRPRRVEGGIKARSQHGKIGETWWSGRWLTYLESLDLGARLARGRSYARAGQVMSLEVEEGGVTARVQGSRPRPYSVTIQLATLSAAQWGEVIDAMASQAIFAAKLLAGEMPRDIEEAFQSAGVPLFPASGKDLVSECSCPDWANPCKHVAAVYYLLAEEFDRDPFLIFRLRGMEKDELIAALRQRRTADAVQLEAAPAEREVASAPAETEAPPLEACMDRFWSSGPELASFRVALRPPAVPLAILKRLGPPPFWKRDGDVMAALAKAYEAAGREALRLAYGEGADGGNATPVNSKGGRRAGQGDRWSHQGDRT